MFQKEHDLYPVELTPAAGDPADHGIDMQQLQLDSILDESFVNFRGGLYVYINAMVGCVLEDMIFALTLSAS